VNILSDRDCQLLRRVEPLSSPMILGFESLSLRQKELDDLDIGFFLISAETRLLFDKPNPAPNSDDIDFYGRWKDGPTDLDINEIVQRWRSQE